VKTLYSPQKVVYLKPCRLAGSHTAPFWACIRTKGSHTHCVHEFRFTYKTLYAICSKLNFRM